MSLGLKGLIGDFQVAFCLSLKSRPSAKCNQLLFTHKARVKENVICRHSEKSSGICEFCSQ